jgi:transposase
LDAARRVVVADTKRKRRQFNSEEKAAILRRHMVEKVAVSDLCNELGIQPSLFYYWQRQALENLAAALSGPAPEGPSKREKELATRNRRLEEQLARKDSVIAEISAEYVQLKKELGEP